MAGKFRTYARNEIERKHPGIAQQADGSLPRCKQTHKPICKTYELCLIGLAPTGEPGEEFLAANVPFRFLTNVRYAITQCSDISHAEIKALRRYRVQSVRCIAHEDSACRRQSKRLAEYQRVCDAFADA